MSAVASTDVGARPRPWLDVVMVGKIYIFFSALSLIGFIMFPLHLMDRLPYSMFPALPLSFFVIMGALAIRGNAVLRLTKWDIVMFVWIVLTIVSQIYAMLNLNRTLVEGDIMTVGLSYFTMWFVYRAFYAMTVVNPKFTVNATLLTMLGLITCACILGILQAIGPVRQQAVDLGIKIGVGQKQIFLGASEMTGVRTTSVFSGPNIYGYINVLGALIVLAIGISIGKQIRERHAILAMALMSLFAYANLNSQSRSSFVLALIVIAIYLGYLVRIQKWRSLLVAATMLTLGVVFFLISTQRGQYEYVTSIVETGIQKDPSYLVRIKGITEFFRMAPEIPVLGIGQDFYTLSPYGRGDFYSKANAFGDLGIAFFYLSMGIPGLLFFVWMNVVAWRAYKGLEFDERAFLTRMKWISGSILILLWITIPFSTRYPKFETFAYVLAVFGMLFALLDVQKRGQLDSEIGMPATPST